MPDFRSTRRGHTLLELAAVLATVAVLCAVALPASRRALDAIAVRSARDEVAAILENARRRALWRSELVDVLFDSSGAVRLVGAAGDTVLARPTAAVLGATLASDRRSVSYAPTGLGFGVSNARLVLARGASADTLWLSRLGRIRR
jgi:Tfp pilus assembly protein FimT